MKRATHVVATTLVLVGFSSIAYGWDSGKQSGLQTFPNDSLPFYPQGFNPDPLSINGTQRFSMRRMTAALGGPDADGAYAPTPTGVYACRPGFLLDGELSNCRLAKAGDLQQRDLGWINARESWDGGEGAEHLQITREAARAAGLLDATSLFDKFWVRYPAKNAYVTSAINDSSDPASYSQLVAPSLEPTEWADMETLATRGISLAELSQLPDYSSSLDDWLLGNEKCPIENTEGAYAGASLVNSCHDFSLTMGGLNVTHFAPLNREMFEYYHGLAKQQMRSCSRLFPLVENFYTHFLPQRQCTPLGFCTDGRYASNPTSTKDTEAHECERQAFMYEMVAQHYLEDAWSTGHMFKRWGYPHFEQFQPDVELPVTDDPPEPANEQARRAGIMLTLAAYAGTIHGAKSVVYNQVARFAGPDLAALLEQTGRLDDPLSGPFFTLAIPFSTDRQRTSWRWGAGVHPGAGDLFWNPPAGAASVFGETVFDVQRSKLLGCSAKSMRDVYDTPAPDGGPIQRAHGVADPPSIPLIDPLSDECWDHWATNQTMLGAIGPVDLVDFLYRGQIAVDKVVTPALLMGATTGALIYTRGYQQPNFPRGRSSEDPEEQVLIHDRDVFLERLAARTQLDFLNLATSYAQNAFNSPDGVESAKGIGPNGEPITMLSVPPMETNNPRPAIPNVHYLDPPNGTLGMARKVLWRSDIENVCRTSTANGSAVLLNLRDQCRGLAAQGGDPDSCTACVELAEMHIPRCSRVNPEAPENFTSKCSTLGVEDVQSPPAGLPAWWFKARLRTQSGAVADAESIIQPSDCGFDPYFPAFHWCTGTQDPVAEEGTLTATATLKTEEVTLCGDAARPPTLQRIGVVQMEVAENDGQVSPFLRPVVAAFEMPVKSVEQASAPGLPSCSWRVTSPFFDRVKAGVAPAQLWDNELAGVRQLYRKSDLYQMMVPRCGTVQRASWWNRPCPVALALLGQPADAPADYNSPTGEMHSNLGYTQSCYVREKRELVADCPGSMVCAASGQCSGVGVAPQVIRLDTLD